MPSAAIYARYSSEEQRQTSIDDQIRRCREVAAREGLVIDERLVLADHAITGKASGTARRLQYRHLIDAVEARQCDIVIADELSRLTRAIGESARLMELVEHDGLRVVTHCGIDTSRDGWKTMWLAKAMVAMQEVDNTSSRVSRGLVGQLDRGFQIAPPAYGYRTKKESDGRGNALGTIWLINEPEAAVVREIFNLRFNGHSAQSIAATLNKRGVAPPGHYRRGSSAYWRPTTIFRMLANQIYRGTFVFHGSTATIYLAKKRRKPMEPVDYPRPECRLVDDEMWEACNTVGTGAGTGRRYSGGVHLLSSLLRCGSCGSIVSVCGDARSRTLICARCDGAHRIGGEGSGAMRSTTTAAMHALKWVLEQIVAGPVREAFHKRLKARIESRPGDELSKLKGQLADLEARAIRLKALAMNPALEPDLFSEDLAENRRQARAVRASLSSLEGRRKGLTKEALAAQVAADPSKLIDELLRETKEPYRVRAMLRRLLESFRFVAKPGRGKSIFEITLKPGVLLAECSSTTIIEPGAVSFQVAVSCTAARPIRWTVEGRVLKFGHES